MRRNLIFAVGDETPSHLNWAARCPERTWDIVLSYFGAQGRAPAAAYDGVAPQGRGLKWGAIWTHLTRHPEVLESYDYVWFPDDDIVCDPQDIDPLFAHMRQFDLEIGQPALTMDSYYSHLITLQQPDYLMRRTNFVEVMMPCIQSSYLKRLLPLMEGSYTGWGLDFGWANDQLTQKAGIIDAIAMTHARPIGGGKIYDAFEEQGLGTIGGEVADAFGRFGLKKKITLPLGGVRKDGREVQPGWRAQIDYFSGLRRLAPKNVDRDEYRRTVSKYARKMLRHYLAHGLGYGRASLPRSRGAGTPAS